MLAVASAGEHDARGTRIGSMRHEEVRPGRPLTFDTTLNPSECLLLVAQAGQGIRDLDLTIRRLGASGTPLSRVTARGGLGQARHCAGARIERLRFLVASVAGRGRVVAAIYRVAAPPPSQAIVIDSTSPLERLSALVERDGARYAPITPPALEPALEAGTFIERTVPLAPGRCYRVFAAGSAGVTHLSISIRAPRSDAELQNDGAELATPTLGVLRPLCPATAGEHHLRFQVEAGSGRFAWRVYAQAQRAAAVARLQTYAVGGDGSGYVPSRLRSRHRVVGRGGLGVIPLAEGALRRSGTVEVPVEVRAGRCYVAIAAGVPSVRSLSLSVRDTFGQERATGAAAPQPHARFCPSIAGQWTVRVKAEVGYGRYGMQVFSQPR